MPSQLLDTDLQYATPSDVERYIRNKSFDGSSDPTETEVDAMLSEASERIDRMTRRSWRTRQVSNRTQQVEFDHSTESAFARRRRRASRHGAIRRAGRWGKVFLGHMNLQAIDPAEGDKIEIINPNGVEDVTSEGPGRDQTWYLDKRKGVLEIDASEFVWGPIRGEGMVVDPRVEVTYRYGQTSDDTDGDGVPDDLPPSITEACAKFVAADLIDTDTYGSVVASGPENTPDQTTAASRLREQATETVQRYRQRGAL